MRRHRETAETFPVVIKDFGAVPDALLKLRVSRVMARGRHIVEISTPFDAFTEARVKKFCGTNGVMLTCGLIVPWEYLEDHRRLVIVRQPPDRISGLPTVLLNSLVRPGLSRIK
ncbi:hypothetical protein A3B42_00495 [Candidatus Daviesbacteria bacterium RIFCSPLOWO2_01_FULL_38_10]|nr:MAG: hypothetical protein A3D02_00055 [Candidatus Daviesbacteria bacterium RIFCSPHIGHO2_02_FULL_39_41]OGE39419.1 MAG: hypothetical protein A3B42_00495 [Candidatus Daviesbacteria bacterium RIFCSPLOWO2_01_FULL_38_10]OGE44229.1 MAG: hypothetical protein A3E67_05030 [Candidatus Daviesbacteria bacterium RIFCSPHIGHO2_12_FULL_38_25]OGE68408.1 MAG: hypothetical protein A3H81_02630 [Candidatus Daviesbacteria bacterium RIFCSPLOWO2_02_FULL_38_18]OGE72204.1 MAG: hypothetical protein A3H18_01785 [Candida